MTTRKKAVRQTTKRTSSARVNGMRSFKIEKDTIPFTSTKLTKQTLYWILILVFIVILQLWIVKLQTEVADLTDALTILQQTSR